MRVVCLFKRRVTPLPLSVLLALLLVSPVLLPPQVCSKEPLALHWALQILLPPQVYSG